MLNHRTIARVMWRLWLNGVPVGRSGTDPRNRDWTASFGIALMTSSRRLGLTVPAYFDE